MPSRIEIIDQDLTTIATDPDKFAAQKLDAIVYGAAADLTPSSPLAVALHQAAGSNLAIEATQLAPCPIGEARITRAYGLPCKYLIHAVPPRLRGGKTGEEADEDRTLAGCYRNALHLAKTYDINTIALAALTYQDIDKGGDASDSISAGTKDSASVSVLQLRAAHIAMTELLLFLKSTPSFKRVMLCCPDEDLARSYESAFDKHAA